MTSASIDGASVAAAVASAQEEVTEFRNTPSEGRSLFVHATWNMGVCTDLSTSMEPEAVLCQVLACDGETCWEGSVRCGDLSASLRESWSDDKNLCLLLKALALRGSSALTSSLACSPARSAGSDPEAEATWSCEEAGEVPLKLVIRFIYREGPIVAVKGVFLQPTSLGAGLSRFFALARGAQVAASACVEAAREECASLRAQRDVFQMKLEMLDEQLLAEEERLLGEFTAILNAQKRRCRKLLIAKRKAMESHDPGRAPPVLAPATASIEESLCRGMASDDEAGMSCRDGLPSPSRASAAPLRGASKGWEDTAAMCSLAFASQPPPPAPAAPAAAEDTAMACSLTFASQPLPAALPAASTQEGHQVAAAGFSIPLVMGMEDFHPPPPGAASSANVTAGPGGQRLGSTKRPASTELLPPPETVPAAQRPRVGAEWPRP